MSMKEQSSSRRKFITATSGVMIAGIAGCTGEGSTEDDETGTLVFFVGTYGGDEIEDAEVTIQGGDGEVDERVKETGEDGMVRFDDIPIYTPIRWEADKHGYNYRNGHVVIPPDSSEWFEEINLPD